MKIDTVQFNESFLFKGLASWFNEWVIGTMDRLGNVYFYMANHFSLEVCIKGYVFIINDFLVAIMIWLTIIKCVFHKC